MDYIYEKGQPDSNFKLETVQNKKYTSNPDIILLTMRGAIKFNMWKRTAFIKNSKYYFFFHFF